MAKSGSLSNKTTILTVFVLLLAVALVIMSAKYVWAKWRWGHYAMQMQQATFQYPVRLAEEDAMIIATAVGSTTSSNPLYLQPAELQTYVNNVSKETGRDLVIVDINKKILADTIQTNNDNMYNFDGNNEVLKTIQDGQTRYFTEQSSDYPAGISEAVVPMKDPSGKTVGAIIFSYDSSTR